MKIKIITIAFLLTCCVFAQPFGHAVKGYRVDRSYYRNASGEIARTYYMYDDEGMLFKTFWTLDNGERWSINYYTHDSKGNLCGAFREFSDSLYSNELFIYDKKGNKIKEYFYRSDSVAGSAEYKYVKNKLIEAHYDRYKGWLNGNVKYFYEKNQLVKGEIRVEDELGCVISYEYDDIGNLIREHWDFQGRWEQTFEHEYVKINMKKQYYSSPYFNDLGTYRISKETYTYNNKIGGPSYYYYNDDNELEKKEFVRSDGLKTITTFNYKKKGNLETSERLYSDGNTGYFSYIYDDRDRLIIREFYRDDTLVAFESHAYDKEGRLFKTYLKNFDGWLNGTIDYHFDRSDKISGGVFHGEDGFNADLSFMYDDAELLNEIIWTFSNGDFQKYTFEYESIK